MNEKITYQIQCPHHMRIGGIEGCTAGRTFNCSECDHPDKKMIECRVTWASTV